jgi:threonine/homoserine/homoserine lactone efflux protein
MPDSTHLTAFFLASVLLAITPGLGIFYVLARSLAGGKKEGALSAAGTFLGGLVHVLAAALGLSVILATSATAFAMVKFTRAAYLVFIGIQMIRTRNVGPAFAERSAKREPRAILHYKGFGPKCSTLRPLSSSFHLFHNSSTRGHGHLFAQFLLLGTLSVTLNTLADLLVVQFAGPLGQRLRQNPQFRRRQRTASGAGMIGLGVFVAAADSR